MLPLADVGRRLATTSSALFDDLFLSAYGEGWCDGSPGGSIASFVVLSIIGAKIGCSRAAFSAAVGKRIPCLSALCRVWLVIPARFERATCRLGGGCSVLLSYGIMFATFATGLTTFVATVSTRIHAAASLSLLGRFSVASLRAADERAEMRHGVLQPRRPSRRASAACRLVWAARLELATSGFQNQRATDCATPR